MTSFQEIHVLIPCHSLEDFPAELSEEDAEGLLNAFAVAWHPALLAHCRTMPHWSRADEPPLHVANHLFLIPPVSDGWMPHEWAEQTRAAGGLVISGARSREEYLTEIQTLLSSIQQSEETSAATVSSPPESVDTEPSLPDFTAVLLQDFFAFGICWLMIELLTRKMHYYSSLDDSSIERESVSAAEASLAGDEIATRTRLKGAFETLLEDREHFYPVDCYLLDICLLNPETLSEHLDQTLASGLPMNVLVKAEDLKSIAQDRPEQFELLCEAIRTGQVDVVGGDRYEKPISLQTIQSLIWDLQQGHDLYRELVGSTPRTWARKRYGFSTQLPQILEQFGYHSALHVALDDGLYPDEEQSKLRWEGCDGTVIDAVSRIPLAAEGAMSFLRFPDRMAESMQDDQVAGILFARWPEVKSPFLNDFRRIHEYAPVLGKFSTFDEYIQTTDHSGRLSIHDEAEYLSPYFLQAVAYGEQDGASRYQSFLNHRHLFDRAAWFAALRGVLSGVEVSLDETDAWEDRIERSGPDLPEDDQKDDVGKLVEELQTWDREQLEKLAKLLIPGNGTTRGLLLVNTLAHSRTSVVSLAGFEKSPAPDGQKIKAVQFDRRQAVVEVPGSGFLWILEPAESVTSKAFKYPSAEELTLRNELFEVLINEKTGGIQHLKNHGRSPNRLSQQLSYRFPRERKITIPGDPPQEIQSAYVDVRMVNSEITSSGPSLGEIVTSSEIFDQTSGEVLATCRQTVQVWRGLPEVHLRIELETKTEPDGDPWNTYFASRFAWKDETAALTRGLLQGAHGIRGERIEAPYYLEIASGDLRTTLLFGGLPFHRRFGDRMLDTILVAPGETCRTFEFRIAVDEPYPLLAAHSMLMPPGELCLDNGPSDPTGGWFFHLKERNIQILSIQPIHPVVPASESETDEHSGPELKSGFALRLLETEGRSRRVKLRLFRTPQQARKRDFRGRTIKELSFRKESLLLEMRPHELVDVELLYAD